eukprot:424020_1
MTSLDMRGFSITLLKVNDLILNALDYRVAPIAWIPGQQPDLKTLINGGKYIDDPDDAKSPNNEQEPKISDLTENGAKILKKYIKNACLEISNKKKELNEIDKICGDGDTGSTLEHGAQILVENMTKFNFKSIYLTLRLLGELLSDMGGSSGALYGYLFIRAATRYKECCGINGKKLNGKNIANAFIKAVNDLSEYSGAKPGDRTMIDALYPAANALLSYYKQNQDQDHVAAIQIAAKVAARGAEATKTMTPKFGRSVYIP